VVPMLLEVKVGLKVESKESDSDSDYKPKSESSESSSSDGTEGSKKSDDGWSTVSE
jgi:hypothetical protein